MNHTVTDVTGLHTAANNFYTNVVVNGADAILANLDSGIENLKSNWKGKDAGVRIQEVILVHNDMVIIRNALAQFAVDSSKIAVNYREIQNTNGAGLETLSPLSFESKSNLSDYTDNADMIDINPSAENGRNSIDSANNGIADLLGNVTSYYEAIMNIWQKGTGRDSAQEAYEMLKNKGSQYQEVLTAVSTNITNALSNYSF